MKTNIRIACALKDFEVDLDQTLTVSLDEGEVLYKVLSLLRDLCIGTDTVWSSVQANCLESWFDNGPVKIQIRRPDPVVGNIAYNLVLKQLADAETDVVITHEGLFNECALLFVRDAEGWTKIATLEPDIHVDKHFSSLTILESELGPIHKLTINQFKKFLTNSYVFRPDPGCLFMKEETSPGRLLADGSNVLDYSRTIMSNEDAYQVLFHFYKMLEPRASGLYLEEDCGIRLITAGYGNGPDRHKRLDVATPYCADTRDTFLLLMAHVLALAENKTLCVVCIDKKAEQYFDEIVMETLSSVFGIPGATQLVIAKN